MKTVNGLLGRAVLPVILSMIGLAASARGQGQCREWTPGLFPIQGVFGTVQALASFDDGTGVAVYVGGDFTKAGGIRAEHIARWNGSVWSSVGTGTNGVVRALVVFDDGTGPALYAAGSFSMASGTTSRDGRLPAARAA